MTLDQHLLQILIDTYPDTVSFESFSRQYTCSKEDFLEASRILKNKKYPVSYTNSSLYLTLPLISKSKLSRLTQHTKTHHPFIVKEAIPSTNTFALNSFSSFEEGSVILAHHQTKGKGRLGRQWSATMGKSIALSLVLRPTIDSQSLPLFTQLTAAALCQALKAYGDTQIKWPNDIVLNGKKVAGILIESQFQENRLEGLVIGIGINTHLEPDDFEDSLLHKATSLKIETKQTVDPNVIIADFLIEFDQFYTDWLETRQTFPFISLCKKESALLGKEIHVYSPNEPPKTATVKDINEKGELIVHYQGHAQLTPLQSLDFSVRNSQNGYI
ncbi:hypothetical protein GCM10008932_01680 [Alkalibacterium iburiense]|uniref:BPL/LPL catalytic domain-containing protein n=1 Tax=Alkalibacterium iburiense TaxID=290589 RepID=A0ABN0X0Y2_9LACT